MNLIDMVLYFMSCKRRGLDPKYVSSMAIVFDISSYTLTFHANVCLPSPLLYSFHNSLPSWKWRYSGRDRCVLL